MIAARLSRRSSSPRRVLSSAARDCRGSFQHRTLNGIGAQGIARGARSERGLDRTEEGLCMKRSSPRGVRMSGPRERAARVLRVLERRRRAEGRTGNGRLRRSSRGLPARAGRYSLKRNTLRPEVHSLRLARKKAARSLLACPLRTNELLQYSVLIGTGKDGAAADPRGRGAVRE
jgi:hypothetical protein